MTMAAAERSPNGMADAVLNSLPHPVITVGAEGRVVDANAAAEDFFQVGAPVMRRHRLKEFVPFGSPLLALIEQVRARGVVLAGPNVTDFEPPYNYGFLKAMERRGELPDIHTNNLFVERVIRPEAFDHRVAGRWMTQLLKLNLVKKARVLGRLSDSFGIAKTYSTTAFWTLPRIGRRLVDSEEKQADYLTRYMILTAASGGLQRAYWGPLVSQREGLVDDATGQPATHELVGRYTQNNGCWRSYVRRPSFSAMATFNKLIPGTRYLGEVPTGNGLHIHRFANEERQVHVVWATHSQAAMLGDIYTAEDLEQAQVFVLDQVALSVGYLTIPHVHPEGLEAQTRHMRDIGIDGGFVIHSQSLVCPVGIGERSGVVGAEERHFVVCIHPAHDSVRIYRYRTAVPFRTIEGRHGHPRRRGSGAGHSVATRAQAPGSGRRTGFEGARVQRVKWRNDAGAAWCTHRPRSVVQPIVADVPPDLPTSLDKNHRTRQYLRRRLQLIDVDATRQM